MLLYDVHTSYRVVAFHWWQEKVISCNLRNNPARKDDMVELRVGDEARLNSSFKVRLVYSPCFLIC